MLNSGLGAAGTFWLYGLICLGGGIFVVFRLQMCIRDRCDYGLCHIALGGFYDNDFWIIIVIHCAESFAGCFLEKLLPTSENTHETEVQ